jgi:hypothetical protein
MAKDKNKGFNIGLLIHKFLIFVKGMILNLVNQVDENGKPLTGEQKKAMLDLRACEVFQKCFEELIDIPVIPDFIVDNAVEQAMPLIMPKITQFVFDLLKFDPTQLTPEALSGEVK